VHHRLSGERTGRSFRLCETVEVKVMRVDLDERKIDFEMSEATVNAPVGRKQRGAAETAPAGKSAPAGKGAGTGKRDVKQDSKREATSQAKPEAKAEPAPRRRKNESSAAYFPSDAVQRNAEVRKSREVKTALMGEARNAPTASKSGKSSSKPASDKPSKHRKGPSKSGAPRKSKNKS